MQDPNLVTFAQVLSKSEKNVVQWSNECANLILAVAMMFTVCSMMLGNWMPKRDPPPAWKALRVANVLECIVDVYFYFLLMN